MFRCSNGRLVRVTGCATTAKSIIAEGQLGDSQCAAVVKFTEYNVESSNIKYNIKFAKVQNRSSVTGETSDVLLLSVTVRRHPWHVTYNFALIYEFYCLRPCAGPLAISPF